MSQTKNIKRNVFTKTEDQILINFVQQYGENWKIISSLMNRNIRQVRERYNFYLNPSINNNPWTQEEDKQLKNLIEKHGKKWKIISQHFDGKNEIQMKNRWNYTLSKEFSRKVERSSEENQSQIEKKNKEFDLLNHEEDIEFYLFSIQSFEFDDFSL
jgi:hypothetical protein